MSKPPIWCPHCDEICKTIDVWLNNKEEKPEKNVIYYQLFKKALEQNSTSTIKIAFGKPNSSQAKEIDEFIQKYRYLLEKTDHIRIPENDLSQSKECEFNNNSRELVLLDITPDAQSSLEIREYETPVSQFALKIQEYEKIKAGIKCPACSIMIEDIIRYLQHAANVFSVLNIGSRISICRQTDVIVGIVVGGVINNEKLTIELTYLYGLFPPREGYFITIPAEGHIGHKTIFVKIDDKLTTVNHNSRIIDKPNRKVHYTLTKSRRRITPEDYAGCDVCEDRYLENCAGRAVCEEKYLKDPEKIIEQRYDRINLVGSAQWVYYFNIKLKEIDLYALSDQYLRYNASRLIIKGHADSCVNKDVCSIKNYLDYIKEYEDIAKMLRTSIKIIKNCKACVDKIKELHDELNQTPVGVANFGDRMLWLSQMKTKVSAFLAGDKNGFQGNLHMHINGCRMSNLDTLLKEMDRAPPIDSSQDLQNMHQFRKRLGIIFTESEKISPKTVFDVFTLTLKPKLIQGKESRDLFLRIIDIMVDGKRIYTEDLIKPLIGYMRKFIIEESIVNCKGCRGMLERIIGRYYYNKFINSVSQDLTHFYELAIKILENKIFDSRLIFEAKRIYDSAVPKFTQLKHDDNCGKIILSELHITLLI